VAGYNAVPVVGAVIEELRRVFVDLPDNMIEPLGGRASGVQHRAGEIIALDLWDGCSPLLTVQVTRMWRTTSATFPSDDDSEKDCGGVPALRLSAGIMRCATGFEVSGGILAVSASVDVAALEREALVTLDDASRLDVALCRAAAVLQEREVISAAVIGAWSPYGPEGGAVGGEITLTVELDTNA